MIIRTTSRQHTGGAMKRKDQPEWKSNGRQDLPEKTPEDSAESILWLQIVTRSFGSLDRGRKARIVGQRKI